MRVSSRRIDDIHNYLKIPKEIYIASMVVKLSDEVNVVFQEKAMIHFIEFISDVGGAAGVILGLKNYFSPV